jgi:hypothetical protein
VHGKSYFGINGKFKFFGYRWVIFLFNGNDIGLVSFQGKEVIAIIRRIGFAYLLACFFIGNGYFGFGSFT